MPLAQLFSPPLLNLPDLRRRTQILLLVGVAELLTFLGCAMQNFYGGSHTIGLLVHAYLPTPAGTPHLSRFIESSVGVYSTGSTGQLLYHASSLGDYLLFFSIADFGFLDALFIFFAFLYLHLAVARLQPGHELSVGISRAFFRIGLGSTCMFMAKMQFNLYVAAVFDEKTQHQFALVDRSSGMLYALLGSLLLLCAPFLQLGNQLQQDAELTI
jgi:hypothetical protein